MGAIALDVRAALVFDQMTAEGKAGKVQGWLEGDRPLAEVYPEMEQASTENGVSIATFIRQSVEVAAERKAGEKWVLRSGFFHKAIGAYLISELGMTPREAVKHAQGYTKGWQLVEKDKLMKVLGDIDKMSKGAFIDAAEANVAAQPKKPVPTRSDLAKAIRDGKFNLGNLTDEILLLLEG